MSKRVQLSLIFDDTEVFDGLVLPWKNNRELNPLVIKLLTAYYYSDDIRALVDSYGEEDLSYEGDNTSFEDSIANAKNTLAFMNMLTEGAKTVLSGGMDEINNIASATGGKPAEETEFGMGLPKFNPIENSSPDANTSSIEDESSAVEGTNVSKRVANIEAQLSNMSNLLTQLCKAMGTVDASVLNQGTPTESVTPIVEDTLSSEEENEPTIESTDTVTSAEELGTSEEESTPVAEEVVSVSSDIIEGIKIDETTKDISLDNLSDLLNSDTDTTDVDSEVVMESPVEQELSKNEEVPVVEEPSKDKSDEYTAEDGSDSLSAFLSSGIGFSVKL